MAPEQVTILGQVPPNAARPAADARRRALPLFTEGVTAGFPSPADDYIGRPLQSLDLTPRWLVPVPSRKKPLDRPESGA